MMNLKALPQAEISRAAAAKELLARRSARANILPFVKYIKPNYQAQWYHKVLAEHLDKFARREIKNLMVFMPPQHGKSEMVSRALPSYLFGLYPDAKVTAASYAAELIQSMNRDVQRLMSESSYQKLFPQTQLNGTNIRSVSGGYLRNSDTFEIVGATGRYRCAGVGGSLTGFPSDFGIIDDPYKDYKEAMSETVRKAVWEWYTSVFLSRTHSGTGKLLTQTRWHEADLAGRLLEMEGDQWTVLKLPAICDDVNAPFEQREEGEALWPSRFDAETLEQRRALNPHQFEALYQQNPTPRAGGMFPREKFGAPLKAVPHNVIQWVRYWDKAGADEGKGDYTAGALLGKMDDGRFIVADVQRFQKKANDRNQLMLQTAALDAATYGRVKIYIERPPGLGAEATDIIVRQMAGYDVSADQARGKKEENAEPFASQVQAGNVCMMQGDWNPEFLSELGSFPNGKHDDQVDAASHAFIKLSAPVVKLAPRKAYGF